MSNKEETKDKIELQQSLKQKGNDCLQSNKKSGFLDDLGFYTQAIEVGEFDKELASQLYSNRAHVHLMLGKNVEAVDDCRKGITANPDNVKCYWRAGRASLALELYEQAKGFVQDGMKIDKDNSELKNLHVQCQKKLAAQMKAKRGIDCTPAEAQEQQDKVEELGSRVMKIHNEVTTNGTETKRAQLTLHSLLEVPEDVPLFKPIGRAFVSQDRGKFQEGLEKEINDLQKQAPKLKKNREEMATRRQNAEKDLQEMMLGLRRNQEKAFADRQADAKRQEEQNMGIKAQ